MRITLNLPDALANEAKSRAAREGISFTSFIEVALQDRLSKRQSTVTPEPLPTFGTPSRRPFLVDIDNAEALRAVLEADPRA